MSSKTRSPGKVIVPTEAFEFMKGFGCLQVFMGHYQLWTKVDYGHDKSIIREVEEQRCLCSSSCLACYLP